MTYKEKYGDSKETFLTIYNIQTSCEYNIFINA